MKKVLFFGVCVAGGVLGAKLIRKGMEKALDKFGEEKVDKVVHTTDTVVTIGCTAIALKCAYDIVMALDERSRVTYMMTLMNSALIGNIDVEVAREVVKRQYPTFGKKAKLVLEPFINATFPELLGGE